MWDTEILLSLKMMFWVTINIIFQGILIFLVTKLQSSSFHTWWNSCTVDSEKHIISKLYFLFWWMMKAIAMSFWLCWVKHTEKIMLKNKKWESEIIRCIFIWNYSYTLSICCAGLGVKIMTSSAVLIESELANPWNIPVLYSATTE